MIQNMYLKIQLIMRFKLSETLSYKYMFCINVEKIMDENNIKNMSMGGEIIRI